MELKKKAEGYIIDATDWHVEFGNLTRKEISESYVVGNQRPIRRNHLIARTLYYSKDMGSFATGLKRCLNIANLHHCLHFYKEFPKIVDTLCGKFQRVLI